MNLLDQISVVGQNRLAAATADHFEKVSVDFEMKQGWDSGDSFAESASCVLHIAARATKDFDYIKPSYIYGVPGRPVSMKAGGWVSTDEDFLYSLGLSELIGEVLAAGEDD